MKHAAGRSKLGLYRQLIANMSDAVAVIDRTFRYIERNDAHRRLFGYSDREFFTMSPSDFVGRKKFQAACRVLRAEGSFRGELTCHGEGGRRVHVETAYFPVRDDEGRTIAYAAVHRDIGQRKSGEGRLEAQYEVTRALAESPTLKAAGPRILESLCRSLGWIAGGLWQIDPGAQEIRCVEFWNDPVTPVRAFEKISRASRFPRGIGLPGVVWADPKPAWLRDVVVAPNFPRARIGRRCGLHAAFAAPIRLGDQILGVIEFFNREILPPDEDLLQMMAGVGSQIGQFIERRRAEAELRHQKSVLESQTEASADGILVVAPDGRILSRNRRFAEMWKIPEDVLGMGSDAAAIDHVLPKIARPDEFIAGVKRLYRRPRETSLDEILLKDGRRFERFSAPVLAEDGSILGRVWYFRDVTAQKRAQEEQRKSADEARRALAELKRARAEGLRNEKLALVGMLVSGVAHEINNPINVVYGNLKLLRERCEGMVGLAKGGRATPEMRRTLATVPGMLRDALKAAESAREVIREFRNFARDPRSAEPTDLNLCVEETLSVVRKNLAGVRVRRRLGRLPPVRCFHGQMNQVLLNLVKNAVEAMGGKGQLTVSTSSSGRKVRVTVADTGPGIPKRERERIFEPFYTTKAGGRSMGLGLSISASIVQNHGGRLSVSSTPGRGAAFTVELPAK